MSSQDYAAVAKILIDWHDMLARMRHYLVGKAPKGWTAQHMGCITKRFPDDEVVSSGGFRLYNGSFYLELRAEMSKERLQRYIFMSDGKICAPVDAEALEEWLIDERGMHKDMADDIVKMWDAWASLDDQDLNRFARLTLEAAPKVWEKRTTPTQFNAKGAEPCSWFFVVENLSNMNEKNA